MTASIVTRTVQLQLDESLQFDRRIRRGWGANEQMVDSVVTFVVVKSEAWRDEWRVTTHGYLRKKDGTIGQTRVSDKPMAWAELPQSVRARILALLAEQTMPEVPEEWRDA